MKVLLLDNYDSFTFNLYQYVGELLSKKKKSFILDIFKNDEASFLQIKKGKYDKIIISPGPGTPHDNTTFGVCAEVIKKLGSITPILGVCLGMQGIAVCFGGKVIPAQKSIHGKTSLITHDRLRIFNNIQTPFIAMRYHSLIVDKNSLPLSLSITALSEDTKEIMGLRHKDFPIEGVQFHPESFATEAGKKLLQNFLFGKDNDTIRI